MFHPPCGFPEINGLVINMSKQIKFLPIFFLNCMKNIAYFRNPKLGKITDTQND